MKVVISEKGFKPQKDRHGSIMFNLSQFQLEFTFLPFLLVTMRVGLGPIVFSHS